MAEDPIQARRHKIVTASADVIDEPFIGLFVNATGTIDIVMPNDIGEEITIQYNVSAGSILPIRPLRITALTATVIGLY